MRSVVPFLKSGCIVLALFADIAPTDFTQVWNSSLLNGVAILRPCSFLIIFHLLTSIGEVDRKSHSTNCKLSIVFSIAIYLGLQVQSGVWVLFLRSPLDLVKSLVILFGYYSLFVPLLDLLTDRLLDKRVALLRAVHFNAVISAAIMLLAWLPIIISISPGYINSDMTDQIYQVYGLNPLSSHHPVISSLISAGVFGIGQSLFGTFGGIRFFLAVQAVVMAVTFSWGLSWLARMGAPKSTVILSLLFWAFVPLFPLWSQVFVKDVLAAIAFTVFIVQVVVRMVHIGRKQDIPRCSRWSSLCIGALVAAMLRNNTILAVIPTLLALTVLERRRVPLVLIGGTISLYACFTLVLLPALGVLRPSSAEALAIPIQQVARTMVEHKDDISKEEEGVLRAVFGDDRYDNVVNYYLPNTSDPMKKGGLFTGENPEGDLGSFIRVWLQLGVRHPGTYLQQLIICGVGYWYPGAYGGDEIPLSPVPRIDSEFFDITEEEIDATATPARAFIGSMESFLGALPVVGAVFDKAFYTWGFAFLFSIIWNKARYLSIVFMPFLITFFACCASPVNSLMRYVLPFVFSFPFMFGIAKLPLVSIHSKEDVNGNHI